VLKKITFGGPSVLPGTKRHHTQGRKSAFSTHFQTGAGNHPPAAIGGFDFCVLKVQRCR
jgi:hypothetical protein